MNKIYLGDAVFAEWNGYGIWLTVEAVDDESQEPTERIYLEPSVVESFRLWYEKITEGK